VIWYRVRDFHAGREFFTSDLGFEEADCDLDRRWALLRHGDTEIDLTEGEPDEEGGVAILVVEDVKAEAERLRGRDVQVGVVLELHGLVRVLDVYDPDGNRVQLTQDLE
jgi:hypothetical protein